MQDEEEAKDGETFATATKKMLESVSAAAAKEGEKGKVG